MNRIKAALIGLMLCISVMTFAQPVGDVAAIDVFENCAGSGSTKVCDAGETDTIGGPIKRIISALLLILGIMAVIVIIIGGIMYTLSTGDASRVKTAKDTILYAVIGLVVAMLAYVIVNFVVGRF